MFRRLNFNFVYIKAMCYKNHMLMFAIVLGLGLLAIFFRHIIAIRYVTVLLIWIVTVMCLVGTKASHRLAIEERKDQGKEYSQDYADGAIAGRNAASKNSTVFIGCIISLALLAIVPPKTKNVPQNLNTSI